MYILYYYMQSQSEKDIYFSYKLSRGIVSRSFYFLWCQEDEEIKSIDCPQVKLGSANFRKY